ncbi:MAG: DNA-3-methyladenine glycosylase 2 family protein [Cytophagia bacterium]|nr:MAG: DNA-3-methyladenine glycosylase 2 family protein [Cytophagia bacterium]TAG44408.1 MAG: DNA-3-methyladenine glycosylase 2 family protein [Cytophagia bacterium]TAH29466.1 MAG: DNA-3-methyladenine glycosylase 2 family protein [Cytophagales bacterium]
MNVTPEIIEHLSKDTILAQILHLNIEIDEKNTWYSDKNIFTSLIRAIIYQQLSVQSAAAIHQRFLDLFENDITTEKIVNINDETYKSIGVSRQKISYLKNLAQFATQNNLSFDYINTMSDDAIIKYLSQIKGIGVWTVQMLLIFDFKRPDIFPLLDLAIQNAIVNLYEIEEKKGKVMLNKVEEIAKNWQPYRTFACLYLWAIKDSNP